MKQLLIASCAYLLRNWRTSALGLLAFLSYLAGQSDTVYQILPAQYHPQAKAVFAVSILLMGFVSRDASNHQATSLPAASPPIQETAAPPTDAP